MTMHDIELETFMVEVQVLLKLNNIERVKVLKSVECGSSVIKIFYLFNTIQSSPSEFETGSGIKQYIYFHLGGVLL